MKIIAHRGGARLAPENSLEAIRVSRNLGVDAAEIDIRITKDNQLVVFHDQSLKRLAGVNRFINKLNLAQIKEMKLKDGSQIPTLTELIDAAGDLPLVIEGKDRGWAKGLAKSLASYPYNKSLRVISFNNQELNSFKQLCPDISCYSISLLNGSGAIANAKKYGFDGIDIHYLAFSPFVYKRAKKNNLKVILFTPNLSFIVKLLAKFYPEIDITTDSPDKFVKLVKSIED